MYNPSYVTSTLSVRYRAPVSYSFNDYAYDYRFNSHLISSSQSCCCVCCSTSYIYRYPLNPRFVCGSRQSSLIHCSASRRLLVQHEPDPYCSWSPIQDPCRRCCCGCGNEKGFGVKMGRDLGERRFKRMVSEGRSCDFETTEMMLSLLIEEVGEESYSVRERDYSSSRRLDFEKKGRESEKKKNVKLGLSGSDSRSKYEGFRIDSRENEARNRRKEDIKSKDEEVFRRRKSGSSCSSYHTCLSLGEESDSGSEIHVRNEAYREESGEGGCKKDSKESGNVVYKGEIKENLRRHEGVVGSHKMIESDWRKKTEKKLNEVAIEDVCETSQHQDSSSHKKFDIFDNKSKKFFHDCETTQQYNRKNDQRDDYRLITEKSNQVSKIEDKNVKRTNISQSEYEDRAKRQENRFSGVSSSVQDTEKRYYLESGEDSRQTDSRRKFQQSADISDDRVSRRDDYSLSTEKSYQVSQIEDINVNRTNISQSRDEDKLKTQEDSYYLKSKKDLRQMDTRRKFQQSAQISDDRANRRDDYRSNTKQSNQVSQIQDINVSRTNISCAKYEDKVKRREYQSSLISSSDQDIVYQYYLQSEEDSKPMDSRRKLLQSTEISDGRVNRSDDFRSSTEQSNQISEIQDMSVRANISLEQYQDKVKRQEDQTSGISSSVQDTENHYYLQSEEDLRQMDSRRKLQESMKIAETQAQDIQSGQQANRKKETAKGSLEMSTIMLGQSSDTQVANIDKTFENRVSSQKIQSAESKRKQETSYNRILRIGSIKETGGTSHKDSSSQASLVVETQSYDDSLTPEDALGSAHRFQKSSSKVVDEFLEKAIHEASTSKSQTVKSTFEEDRVFEEPSEYGDADFKSKDKESRRSSGSSGFKGPSEEIWDEIAPSIQESIDMQIQVPEKTSPSENVIVKRTGRSLWNVFSDIVMLRWSSHPIITTPKSSMRNSPNQSTSEAWFSGQDRYETSEENIKNGNKSTSHESIPTPTEIQGEGYISSSSKDKISPSKTPIVSSTSNGSSSVSTEENPKMGDSIMMETSVSLSSLRNRRSPNFDDVAEFDKRTTVTEEKVEGDRKRKMLQRTNQVVKDRFDEWEETFMLETEQRKIDEGFMREALLEARKAGDMWEVPVGAVLVQHGKIIARGYNLVEELRDSTAHAEMICIREASNQLRSWRLSGTTLYVTLEPCPMCAGAILQARVDTVVWGAPNKLLGADGSWIRLFPDGGEGGTSADPTDKPPAPVHPFHPKISIKRGVLGTECAEVMQQFFQLRRRKNDKKQLTDAPPVPPSCLPVSNHPSKILTKMHGAFNFMFCL